MVTLARKIDIGFIRHLARTTTVGFRVYVARNTDIGFTAASARTFFLGFSQVLAQKWKRQALSKGLRPSGVLTDFPRSALI